MYYNVFGEKVSRAKFKEMENAARNRRELIAAQLHSRRDLMKIGLLTGAGMLLPKRGLSARINSMLSVMQPASPTITPFTDPLPIMPIKQPVASLSPTPTQCPNKNINPANGLIEQWRWEQRGRHERIDQFASIALGEAPTGGPRLQDPELYFWPGLESEPFHDHATPLGADIEAAYPVSHAELAGLLNAKIAFTPYAQGGDARYREEKFNLEEGSDRWSIYNLLEPAAESSCPKTVKLLQRWFRTEYGEPVTAQFSALRAGAHIPPHCGVSNIFLTAHLGLIVPPGCRIRVGSEQRSWSEARALVFDDSFEHEVWNDGSSMRIVFIARFYHPALSGLEIEALGTLHQRVHALVGENTAVQRELLRNLRRRG